MVFIRFHAFLATAVTYHILHCCVMMLFIVWQLTAAYATDVVPTAWPNSGVSIKCVILPLMSCGI